MHNTMLHQNIIVFTFFAVSPAFSMLRYKLKNKLNELLLLCYFVLALKVLWQEHSQFWLGSVDNVFLGL